ncbi:MAG: GxxExxY protein [Bacteroidetes bacterium]|nr:GxxExxY protein [Bacteroidota bacterium]
MVLEKKDLLYPELSYQIIGCAFDVFNELGGGHKEIVYRRAMNVALRTKRLKYTEEQYYPVKFKDVVVGKNFFDFYVEEKIVIELKSARGFTKLNYDQVLNYLNVSKVKLALLITFGTEEVRCKRVVNFQELNKKLIPEDNER